MGFPLAINSFCYIEGSTTVPRTPCGCSCCWLRLAFRFEFFTSARIWNCCCCRSSHNISHSVSALVPRGCPDGLHHVTKVGRCDKICSTYTGDNCSAWPRLLGSDKETPLCDNETTDMVLPKSKASDRIEKILNDLREMNKAEHKTLRPVSSNSITLQRRRTMSESQGFPHHTPARPSAEGDNLAILFTSLLVNLQFGGVLDRAISKSGRLPSTAKCAQQFHSAQWKNFAKSCDPPWLEMDLVHKRKTVWRSFWAKFSRYKEHQSMWPVDKEKIAERSDICWHNFYLTDAEFVALFSRLMTDYQEVMKRLQFTPCEKDSGWDASE